MNCFALASFEVRVASFRLSTVGSVPSPNANATVRQQVAPQAGGEVAWLA